MAAPFPAAVTRPPDVTAATPGSLLDQATEPLKGAPFWSRMVAVRVAVSPSDDSIVDDGERDNAAARGGSGVVGSPDSPQAPSAAMAHAAPIRNQSSRSNPARGPPPALEPDGPIRTIMTEI